MDYISKDHKAMKPILHFYNPRTGMIMRISPISRKYDMMYNIIPIIEKRTVIHLDKEVLASVIIASNEETQEERIKRISKIYDISSYITLTNGI